MCGGGGIIGAISDTIARVGEGVSDVVHNVGTTVAESPILSAATGAALTAAGVPAPVAAGLVQANRGASPEQVLGSAALAGVVDNVMSPAGATTSPVYSPSVTGTDLPPVDFSAAVPSVAPSMPSTLGGLANLDTTAGAVTGLNTGGVSNLAALGGEYTPTIGASMPIPDSSMLGGEYAGGLGMTGPLTGGISNPAALGGEYAGGLGAPVTLTGGISNPAALGGEYGTAGLGMSDAAKVLADYMKPNQANANPSLMDTLTGTPLGQATTIGALGSLLQGYLGSNAANTAAQIQADATRNAINQITGVYNQTSAQNAPYRGLGYQAANAISGLLPGQGQQFDAMGNPIGTTTGSGYLTQQFTPEAFAAGIDPGYAFRLQQGQMANQRAGNVGGGALSGNVLKGLQDYTQSTASQEYANAFDRFQKQRQNIYGNLANIAGIGQTSQGQQNQLASNLAQSTAQMNVGSAAAQAAGQIGQANAYGNAIGSIGNAITLAGLLGQKGNVAGTPTPSNPINTASNTIGSLGNLANTVSNLSNIFG
jgi:hypothetical protein